MLPDDINQPDVLADVTDAFYRYEKALTGNDIAVLDELFWHDEKTVRYGAGENLYGIEEIRAFRLARPSAGLDRTLRNTVITVYGHDMAVASTEFTRAGSTKIGRQMQIWVKMPEGWRIVAAHVSLMSE
ncbi:oxalurate catabolism protein HpxZ [Pectobacterium versatile]|uniref:oxalurate catabolism protein HpxZ n=1 Tax=Pectobacterium versatile TaxID=2488639 RepID=UPI001F366911|nr:oxalurate catabolism protein HpxZ [Pectobacterium versatile]